MSGIQISNLAQRIVSAIILIAVTLTLTWLGGVWYRILAVIIGAAIFYEWIAMTCSWKMKPHLWVLLGLLTGILIALLFGVSISWLLAALFVISVASGIYAGITKDSFCSTGGFTYSALTAISLSALRGDGYAGFAATIFLFAVVWGTDIFAYFSGRKLGGPKLAPSISPGKTWSGAIGGTFAAIIAGLLAASFLNATPAVWFLVALILMLSVVSQMGDLFESSIKRRFGMKDSSRLIPGHGGVMDRVDGLAVASWLLFIVGSCVASVEHPAFAFF